MELVRPIVLFKRALSRKEKQAKTIRRRSPHELQTIFRRLDSNHDGELDMDEFQKVVKLLGLGEDEIATTKAFENADKDNSGKLSMKDFERAYDLLYQDVMLNSTISLPNPGEYICTAIRYGIENGKKIYTIETVRGFAELQGLLKKIEQDSPSIKWWIDIAINTMASFEKERVAELFGLRVKDIFFSRHLEDTRSSRIRSGKNSVSFFIQTSWIKNIPYVHSHPRLAFLLGEKSTVGSILEGFITRVIPFLQGIYCKSYCPAENASFRIAECVCEDVDGAINSTHGDADAFLNYLPIDEKPLGADVPPNYLLPLSDFRSSRPSDVLPTRTPESVKDTIGVHIVTPGLANKKIVLTIRKIQSNNTNIVEASRDGVTGRIFTGIRRLLQKTLMAEITSTADIDDTPESLASAIISYCHQFSMYSVLSLNNWIEAIRSDLEEDLTGTKHFHHIKAVENQIKGYLHYVTPFHEALKSIFDISDQFKEIHNNSRDENECKLDDITYIPNEILKSSKEQNELIKISQQLFSQIHFFRPLIEDTDSDDNDDTQASNSQGTKFWIDELNKAATDVSELMDFYSNSLEEKRNFLTFALTITTIMLCPMTILTGYWGMNFDNMEELSRDTYPLVPGVKLLWVVAGILYGLMFVLGFHYRIFQSAL
mmetsp:Transcript_23709/g.24323  ORF Transcript_23709/g.24323 Transcript_23709/m.24323 type:complete len:656 (-) Transcript_23709:168-2135(-)